ncbi:Leu/Phe/Val dehydrogenase [Nocardioides mangrovicus]|uniref:Leu/Phe/Val dehydrogenase n=1 Tax=Nocardioides mangrovicus TaxID=2478913 RepID=UPI001E50D1D0|nr:amino acid dehydrogenase [Nocardioides mangrovicus]
MFSQSRRSGLQVIVAIHSTARGPALGGTRFFDYPGGEAEAVRDALALSRGMTYKAALAGLDLGGGKAVILGDPPVAKTAPLLRDYGAFVESLGGRYITACDVGTSSPDMDVIAGETRFVTGRAGDSSVLTAYGVHCGMRAAAEAAWGEPSLAGRTVGVAGVGKVGGHLVDLLIEDGARVVVTDVHRPAVEALLTAHPEVGVVDSERALVAAELDVYAPCAMGGALSDDVVAALRARVVCGAANNQLAHAGVAQRLAERGILYAPDYCVNAGGLIQVADELDGLDLDRARSRAALIYDTTREVLRIAEQESIPPALAADRLAEQRIAHGPGLPASAPASGPGQG